MGIFRRRDRNQPDRSQPSTPSGPIDPDLAPLTVADAAYVTSIARDQLAVQGREASASAGTLMLDDGASVGLGNLARVLPNVPRPEWESTIRGHVSSLTRQWGQDADVDPASLLVKLRPKEDLPPGFLTYQPLETLPGIVGVLAADLPEVVQEFGSLGQLPDGLRDRDAAYDRALTNLANLPLPTKETVLAEKDAPGSAIDLLFSEDFFGAARLLVLPELVRRSYDKPIPATGVLVALPSRHLMQLHFPTSVDTLHAVNTMIGTAKMQFDEQPGPISPELFHIGPDLTATQVSFRSDDEVSVRVQGPVEDMFRAIGMLE